MSELPPPSALPDPPASPTARSKGKNPPDADPDRTSGRARTRGVVSRRTVLRGAAAAPLAALPACVAPEPEPAGVPTLAALEHRNALAARPLDAGRLATILPAVRLNHAFFRPVRAVALPDDLEPAVRFHAAGPSPGTPPEAD